MSSTYGTSVNRSCIGSSFDGSSFNRSSIVMCKCGLKACFTIAKNGMNWGRLYYGCPKYKQDACSFFRWVVFEEDLYVEISGAADALELLKLHWESGHLEEDSGENRSLVDENKILKRISLAEGLGGHGMVVDGQLIFRREDSVLAELRSVRTSLNARKFLLFGSCVEFTLMWAMGKM